MATEEELKAFHDRPEKQNAYTIEIEALKKKLKLHEWHKFPEETPVAIDHLTRYEIFVLGRVEIDHWLYEGDDASFWMKFNNHITHWRNIIGPEDHG